MEKYCKLFLPKFQRSLLCQLRLGILPIHLETGRYTGKPVNERICQICNTNEIDDENHFLFKCTYYNDERELFLNDLNFSNLEFQDFAHQHISEKLDFLFKEKIFKFGKFLETIYNKRRKHLYHDLST